MSVYSDQQTILNASRFVQIGFYGQKKELFEDTFTAASTQDTLYCVTPPKGYKFADGKITWAALGTGVTLEVGIGADLSGDSAVPTAFLGSTSAASAGYAFLAPAVAYADYVFDGGTQIIVTIGGAAATGKIVLMLMLANPS